MKNVLISATLSATLGLSAFSSLAQDVDLRMSWWGGNGRHQVTLKALEEFHKQNPDINVKAEYTGWDGHLSRLTTQLAADLFEKWRWLLRSEYPERRDRPQPVRRQRTAVHHGQRQA